LCVFVVVYIIKKHATIKHEHSLAPNTQRSV